MPTPEAQVLIARLDLIRAQAKGYFRRRELIGIPETDFWDVRSADYYWTQLSTRRRNEAAAVASKLIDLGNDSGAAARRSPLLGQADITNIGHSIKGMRAALKLRSYAHFDAEVINDEDVILGIRPASNVENAAHPTDAAKHFEHHAAALIAVLELVGAGPGEAALTTPSSNAPATGRYRPGTAFIMMSMQAGQSDLDDVCDTVKRCFQRFGIDAVRADDIEHEDVITKRILDEIRTAEFLFADLSGERPSVYYEIGYAQALGRRVILFRKAGTVIHFDLAAYNCPEYGNLRSLEQKLMRRLEYVTGQTAREEDRARDEGG